MIRERSRPPYAQRGDRGAEIGAFQSGELEV
jgi:hypothetical protein